MTAGDQVDRDYGDGEGWKLVARSHRSVPAVPATDVQFQNRYSTLDAGEDQEDPSESAERELSVQPKGEKMNDNITQH